MMRADLTIAAFCLLIAGVPIVGRAAPARQNDWIAREKFRGGYLSAGDPVSGVARMKAAGMNAVMPKFGGLQAPPTTDNVKLLGDWGAAARKAGVHLLPVFNFRGGETEKLLSDRREVGLTGQRLQATPCPLDEAFWRRYILGRFVFLAQHARDLNLAGAVLDPEMYGADHTVFMGVCYCDDCLREFLQAAGRPVPQPLPEPAARADWLKQQGLEQRMDEHYVARIRGFCAEIEREVHKAAPDFLLGVLLLDYPVPFIRGVAQGLGTKAHPVLGFSETTYSPGYTEYVDKQQKAFAAMPAHVLFLPGLWQQQFPGDNLAEQYYTCARHSAGYWIYTFESLLEDCTRMPGYLLAEPHERYWAAMKLANSELDKLMRSGGSYVSALKVRAFDPPLPVLATADIAIQPLVPAPDDKPLSLGDVTVPRLRYRNPLFVLAKAGEPVEARVTNLQLANYRPGTQYAVVAPDGTRLTEGHMKVGESAEVKLTPDRDGVYLLVVESGNNSHRIEILTGQPWAFKATQTMPLVVNGFFGRVYFHVPEGVSRFSIFVKAEGQAPGRGGKLTVFDADGKPVAHVEGDLGALTEMPVTVPDGMGKRVWCLSAEGLTNDLSVYFSPNTSPYASPDPRRVLVAK
jgi:hypothetical protein